MSRRGENIRKRKDGRWEGRYIKGYDSKKQKARYASVYGKTYAETKQKLDEAKYKSTYTKFSCTDYLYFGTGRSTRCLYFDWFNKQAP